MTRTPRPTPRGGSAPYRANTNASCRPKSTAYATLCTSHGPRFTPRGSAHFCTNSPPSSTSTKVTRKVTRRKCSTWTTTWKTWMTLKTTLTTLNGMGTPWRCHWSTARRRRTPNSRLLAIYTAWCTAARASCGSRGVTICAASGATRVRCSN